MATKSLAILPSVATLITLANVIATTPSHAQSYGPDTCMQGYVWREARPGDTVCVTPEVRARTAQENATAAERREPNGGPYGPNTCMQGFVWREAFDGDVVCVPPEIREQTQADNVAAESRKQASQVDTGTTDPNGPNFVIYSAADCAVVLNEHGDGFDGLTVYVQLQSLGPATPKGGVTVHAALDSGASKDYTMWPGSGNSMSPVQFAIDAYRFYQRDNRLTITADPTNKYIERVESDNTTVVQIPHQRRPSKSGSAVTCLNE